MSAARTVWLNGRFMREDEACVPVFDRGFLAADGVFETARLHLGAFFRLDSHLQRLRAGLETFRLPAPDADVLTRIANELAARNAVREATLRITVTRGRSFEPLEPTVLVTLTPIPGDWRERAAAGWRIVTAGVRHPPPDALPPHLKCLGRIHGLLAQLESRGAGADDALLLSHEGLVAEGPTWNVFWVRSGAVRTPALDVGVLDGVTRGVLIQVAAELGLTVEEGRWPRDDLDRADEIFATMSSLGCVPFRSLDGRPLPTENPVADRLQRAYWERVGGECNPKPE